MTRDEHMQWCKERALEYADAGDTQGAFASMASDLGKHDETANHIGIQLGMMQLMAGQLDSPAAMRKFIEGFTNQQPTKGASGTAMGDIHETLRDHSRNYIGINGREVYYRIALKHAGTRKGHPGAGPEGWTCCLCAEGEYDCLCTDTQPTTASLRDVLAASTESEDE